MADRTLEGLALISRPLGENDRLLTLLSEAEGLTRLAVPGARRPRSSLAAAVPFALLQLQVGGGRGLQRVRQLRVLRHYGHLGQRLETLAAAQALVELCLALVAETAAPGVLADLLMQLGRLEDVVKERGHRSESRARRRRQCPRKLSLIDLNDPQHFLSMIRLLHDNLTAFDELFP